MISNQYDQIKKVRNRLILCSFNKLVSTYGVKQYACSNSCNTKNSNSDSSNDCASLFLGSLNIY